VSWDEVRKEMVEEKGITESVADRIGHYVKLHGSKELLDQLTSDPTLVAVKDAKVGLEEMGLLFRYCELYGVLDKVGLEWNMEGCHRFDSRCPLTSAWLVGWTITLVSYTKLF
jgi:histidyl-tRNA synthetase